MNIFTLISLFAVGTFWADVKYIDDNKNSYWFINEQLLYTYMTDYLSTETGVTACLKIGNIVQRQGSQPAWKLVA